MIFLSKRHLRIIVSTLIIVYTTLFCNVAHANAFTDGVFGLFSFVNQNILGPVKKDFCRNYILAISTGEWKDGEFRTNLGKSVCTSYTVPDGSVGRITQTVVQPLNSNVSVSQPEAMSKTSVNNPLSDVFAPTVTSGTDLNISHIIYYTNLERNNNGGLPDLKENSVLKSVAIARTKDMFENGYFAHNSPTGDNASKESGKYGYEYITIGENIALGNFDGSRGLVTDWMNSPGHRANILNNKYTEIGVDAEKGMFNGQSVWISTQIFGKPIGSCKVASQDLKQKITDYKTSADSLMTNIKNIDAVLKTLATTDAQTYNSKVAERNTLTRLYNNLASEIKTSVAEYNSEVSSYNNCIKL